ncbi:MAG: F0F1 ATP synthase subunit A [Gracilibacteraceae bacterium]|jgi:F-type H+-transporting ATPase subunit a|nr:F0F1 ATP synthase subunit A [Gracilibacteraceae bacterium]
MHETILWQIGDFGTMHGKTLIMTWMAFIVIFILVILGTRRLTSGTPGKLQNFLEWIVDFVRNIIRDNTDYTKAAALHAYLITLILFVFVSNMLGLVPNIFWPLFEHVEFAKLDEIFHGAALMSPTADINTTGSLALLTFVLIIAYGVKFHGIRYFHHFVEPFPVFLPIHLIDMVAKPMTLAFRLFGNIYAGEVLIGVILMLPGIAVFGGAIPMAVWLGFSVFIGAIQSFVITVLSTAYVAQAIGSDEH